MEGLLQPTHLILILVIALLVFLGPKTSGAITRMRIKCVGWSKPSISKPPWSISESLWDSWAGLSGSRRGSRLKSFGCSFDPVHSVRLARGGCRSHPPRARSNLVGQRLFSKDRSEEHTSEL